MPATAPFTVLREMAALLPGAAVEGRPAGFHRPASLSGKVPAGYGPHRLREKNALYTGFIGHCTFVLGQQVARVHPEHALQVNLLAGFAFYAGVGQKTTMGMGQCMQSRVWNPDELLREVGK